MIKSKLSKIQDFLEKIKNDITIPLISDFLDWFLEKLEIHFNKKTPSLKYKKWDIYFVNLWQNIGSELNKTRPCVIFSDKKANFWNTVIIIPLKSYKKWKKINNFQYFIKKSTKNSLKKDSIIDISSIRQVDKKRILTKKWFIEKKDIYEIDEILIKIFWIKK